MTNIEKAPGWVMGALLLLLFSYAIIGFIGFLDLLPKEETWLRTNNGSVTFFIYKTWWISSVLGLLLFIPAVVLAFKRKWNKIATAGSIISLIVILLGITRMVLLWRADVYNYAWNLSMDNIFTHISNILELTGYILLLWGIRVPLLVRIVVTGYLILVYIPYLLPIPWNSDISLYFNVGRPLLVVVLIALWLYDSRRSTK